MADDSLDINVDTQEAHQILADGLLKQEQPELFAEDSDGDAIMEAGSKRPITDAGGMQPIKKKKVSGPPLPKNALMQLNEIKPGLHFSLVGQHGPVHAAVFVMAVEIDGQTFQGQGKNKKAAKLDAAEKAMRSCPQLREAAEAQRAKTADSTQDSANTAKLFGNVGLNNQNGNTVQAQQQKQPLINAVQPVPTHPPAVKTAPPVQVVQKGTPPQSAGKNPVMILNEMRPGSKYDLVSETGEVPDKNFVYSVMIEGQTFEGSGRSKRLAKARAAHDGLSKLFGLQFAPRPGTSEMPVFQGSDEQYRQFVQRDPQKEAEVAAKMNTNPTEKNAVMRLNELYKNLYYNVVSAEGPVHKANYVIAVEVNGVTFTGESHSKKMAKQDAAEKALRSLDPAILRRQYQKDQARIQSRQNAPPQGRRSMSSTAIAQLYRVFKGSTIKYRSLDHDPIAEMFTMSVEVDGQRFEGTGATKNLAKMEAAQKALDCMKSGGFSASNKQNWTKWVPASSEQTEAAGDWPTSQPQATSQFDTSAFTDQTAFGASQGYGQSQSYSQSYDQTQSYGQESYDQSSYDQSGFNQSYGTQSYGNQGFGGGDYVDQSFSSNQSYDQSYGGAAPPPPPGDTNYQNTSYIESYRTSGPYAPPARGRGVYGRGMGAARGGRGRGGF